MLAALLIGPPVLAASAAFVAAGAVLHAGVAVADMLRTPTTPGPATPCAIGNRVLCLCGDH